MSTFKDMVAHDIDTTFLNTDEFAELHIVEGKEIPVVMDDDRLTTLKQGQILGLVEADTLLMGKVSDFPSEMEPGRLLNVDGRELIVTNTGRDMGLIEVALSQNRTM